MTWGHKRVIGLGKGTRWRTDCRGKRTQSDKEGKAALGGRGSQDIHIHYLKKIYMYFHLARRYEYET